MNGPTLTPFLSVFLLTSIGFSYFTNDAVGGIIVLVVIKRRYGNVMWAGIVGFI